MSPHRNEKGIAMLSSKLTSTALALSLLTVTGCVAEVADDEELSSTEQHLDDDDDEELGSGGSTTSTIYPLMSLELTGIDADSRLEDGLYPVGGWTMDVYGSIAVNNTSLARGTARNLGSWGNPYVKSSVAWGSADGGAPKLYDTSRTSVPQYLFKDTKLCASNTYASCQGSFLLNNNVVQIPVRLGDTVKIDFNFMEYDPLDDDQFCHGSISGVVAKDGYGKYYLKKSGTTSTPLTSATGKADYKVWDAVYGGLIVIPTYVVRQHECTLFFK
jgi:hypothetical protein